MMASRKKSTGPKPERKESTVVLPVDDPTWRECVHQLRQLSDRWENNYRRLSKGSDRGAPEVAANVTSILKATLQAIILNQTDYLDDLAGESAKLSERFTKDLLARGEQLMVDASVYAGPGRGKLFVPIEVPIRGRKYEQGLSGRSHAAQGVVNTLAWQLDQNVSTAALVQAFLACLTIGTVGAGWAEFLSEHGVRLSYGDLDASSPTHSRVVATFEKQRETNLKGDRLAEALFVNGLRAIGVPKNAAEGLTKGLQ